MTFAKVSPDGQYVAMSAPVEGRPGLVVERLADHKITARVSAGDQRGIHDVWWASASRLVTTLYEEVGPLDAPAATGEMIGFDVDYSHLTYLFGFRGNTDEYGFLTVPVADGYATMIDPLPNDPKHVLIGTQIGKNRPPTLIELDVDTAARKSIGEMPERGAASLVIDKAGTARFVSITKDDSSVVRYVRDSNAAPWTLFGASRPDDPGVDVQGLTPDGKSLYEIVRQPVDTGGRYCLATEAIATHERKTLHCDDDAELGHLVWASDRSVPIAVVYDLDRPLLKPLLPEHPDWLALQRLAKTFPDATVEPVSGTPDGSKVVALVHGDRNPGDYYLYDTQTHKADYLLSRRDWINPAEMAPREPIHFKARDGTILHGYLTRPIGANGPLPLIVNPHGGPFGVADTWDWDDDAELLATHGYAVLQVNFRGSRGRGEAFVAAGKKGWATTMIDDITDGARWALEQKLTEPGRLCIYGASYGGFAALMSVEREPDLYRCAVGYSGVYDLNLLAKDADFVQSSGGRHYFRDYIGDGEDDLAKASPVSYVDRLKASLLIVHGYEDPRAPYSQAEALMSSLDARRYPYEKLLRLKEAHGFYSVEHRVEFYRRLLKFLDRNLVAPHGVPP